jgi:hypothetical protein
MIIDFKLKLKLIYLYLAHPKIKFHLIFKYLINT